MVWQIRCRRLELENAGAFESKGNGSVYVRTGADSSDKSDASDAWMNLVALQHLSSFSNLFGDANVSSLFELISRSCTVCLSPIAGAETV